MDEEIKNESAVPAEETAYCCAAPAAETAPAPAEETMKPEAAPATAEEQPADGTCECCSCSCGCAEAAPEEPRKPLMEATQEMADQAKEILDTMLEKLGLEGTVKAEKHASKINLLVASNDAGRIIGRKGSSLEALQLLLNRMISKGEPTFPKVYIDIDGYSSREATQPDGTRAPRKTRPESRDRHFDRAPRGDRRPRRSGEEMSERDEMLRQQALDAAKEVRRWGEDVPLPEMNPHDRRIIHITLENEADITTESVGEGNLKRVVVKQKKQ